VLAGTFVGLMIPLIIDQVSCWSIPSRLIEQLSEFAGRFGIDFTGENLTEAAVKSSDLRTSAVTSPGASSAWGRPYHHRVQLLTIQLFTFYTPAED
jgi:hypothetical protein